jgi:hypothetical protein
MKKNIAVLGCAVAMGALAGCMKNKDISFNDYVYQTVYFGTQYPVRTVELGEDAFVDNTLDNQHKVKIEATLGGVRENTKTVTIGFKVDESLCDRVYFPNNGPKFLPLPASYYQLASNQITITPGNILGGVEVQLTDAFFADPLAITNTYAIPLVLTDAKAGDSILHGTPSVDNPDRTNDANWSVKPRDFVLYVLKYINTWHGSYLRRGKDVITGAFDSTIVRHQPYVEQDEVNKLSTAALTKLDFPLVFKNKSGTNINCTLRVSFDNNDNCTIESITTGVTASGTGKFVKKGDKNSWGNQDRDVLYLDYSVNLTSQNMQIATKDTLVMRDRSVAMETLTPVYK